MQVRQEIERVEAVLGRHVRNQSAAWMNIAVALGVSKQAIQ
ncbi:hypothetical protein [Actinoalloteichus hymeniacidonis]|nr:hypothetical protein [Actinoalloteichus hymeniacidonis]MBB5908751.1 hypothetical protein [Actinoalloteichus hymeniacidonis]